MDRSKSVRGYFTLSNAEAVVFTLAVWLAPANLFLSSRPEWAYLDGVFVDYWAPKLPGSVGLVLLWGLIKLLNLYQRAAFSSNQAKFRDRVRAFFRPFFRRPHYLVIGIGILFLVVSRQLTLESPGPSLAFLAITIGGPIFFAWLMFADRRFISRRLRPALLSAVTLQASLAWLQIIRQAPLAPYWLLGEPRFSAGYSLAASSLPGPWRILPYGSTPHPNVLAGWMALGVFALVSGKRTTITAPLALAFLATLIAAESWTAFLSLAILLIIYRRRELLAKLPPKPTFLWPIWASAVSSALWNGAVLVIDRLGLGTSASFSRRADLLEAVLTRAPQWWLAGTGLLLHIRLTKLAPFLVFQGRFLQPVHSSLLVLASDLGIWILFLLCAFSIFVHYYYSAVLWLAIGFLPMFSLDHYAITTTSGHFLLILLSYFLFDLISPFKPVSRKEARSVVR